MQYWIINIQRINGYFNVSSDKKIKNAYIIYQHADDILELYNGKKDLHGKTDKLHTPVLISIDHHD